MQPNTTLRLLQWLRWWKAFRVLVAVALAVHVFRHVPVSPLTAHAVSSVLCVTYLMYSILVLAGVSGRLGTKKMRTSIDCAVLLIVAVAEHQREPYSSLLLFPSTAAVFYLRGRERLALLLGVAIAVVGVGVLSGDSVGGLLAAFLVLLLPLSIVYHVLREPLGEVVSPNLTADDVADLVFKLFQSRSKHVAAHLLLVRQRRDGLFIAAATGTLPYRRVRKVSVAFGEGITGWSALHHKSLLVSDTSSRLALPPDATYIDVSSGLTRSELAVPVMSPTGVVAVINVEASTVGAFTFADVDFLEGAANVFARPLLSELHSIEHQDLRRLLTMLQSVTSGELTPGRREELVLEAARWRWQERYPDCFPMTLTWTWSSGETPSTGTEANADGDSASTSDGARTAAGQGGAERTRTFTSQPWGDASGKLGLHLQRPAAQAATPVKIPKGLLAEAEVLNAAMTLSRNTLDDARLDPVSLGVVEAVVTQLASYSRGESARDFAAALLTEARAISGAPCASLLRVDSLGETVTPLLVRQSYGPSMSDEGGGRSALQGHTGVAIRTRRSVLVDNVHQSQDYVSCWPETNSELDIPLVLGDAVEGVLNLESDRTGHFSTKVREMEQRLGGFAVTELFGRGHWKGREGAAVLGDPVILSAIRALGRYQCRDDLLRLGLELVRRVLDVSLVALVEFPTQAPRISSDLSVVEVLLSVPVVRQRRHRVAARADDARPSVSAGTEDTPADPRCILCEPLTSGGTWQEVLEQPGNVATPHMMIEGDVLPGPEQKRRIQELRPFIRELLLLSAATDTRDPTSAAFWAIETVEPHVSRATTVNALLDLLYQRGAEWLAADSLYIFTRRTRRDGPVFVARSSAGGRIRGTAPGELRPGVGLLGGAITKRKIRTSAGIERDNRLTKKERSWLMASSDPCRNGSLLAVPVELDDTVAVVLVACRWFSEPHSRLAFSAFDCEKAALLKEYVESTLAQVRRVDLREQLLMWIQHELRQPLGAARNAADELLDAAESHTPQAASRETCELLGSQLRRINRSLKWISVYLSPPSASSEFDAVAVVRNFLTENFESIAKSHRPSTAARSEFLASGLTSLRVVGESELLVTVLENLVKNSCEHFQGSDDILVRVVAKRNPTGILLEYTDNGVGLREDRLESWLKDDLPGGEVHPRTAKHIGMPLCENLVARLQGRIQFGNVGGGPTALGIRVRIWLPGTSEASVGPGRSG